MQFIKLNFEIPEFDFHLYVLTSFSYILVLNDVTEVNLTMTVCSTGSVNVQVDLNTLFSISIISHLRSLDINIKYLASIEEFSDFSGN